MKKKLFFIFLLISAIFIPFKVNAEEIGITSPIMLKALLSTGGELRLDSDISLDSNVEINNDTTLNLNGYTLNMNDKKITSYAKFTVVDNSSSKAGIIKSTSQFTMQVGNSLNDGSLILKSGTIECNGNYGIRNYGSITVDGGTIIGNDFPIYNQKKLVINGGEVHAKTGTVIQNHLNSEFEMNGGKVITDADYQAINLYGSCKATINDGEIIAMKDNSTGYAGNGISLFKDTELIINGGTIKSYGSAIMGNGSGAEGGRSDGRFAKITINGGSITSTNIGAAMYIPQQQGETIITGGTITGPTGIEIRAGNLTISGGTITSTSDVYEVRANTNGVTTKGAAISVVQHTTKQPINVIITGGTIKGLSPISETNPLNNSDEDIAKVNVDVRQGNFISTSDSDIVVINIEPFISGGTYTNDPTNYVKEGHGVIEIPTGYEVTKIHTITIDEKSKDLITLDETEAPYKKSLKFKKIKDKIGYFTIIEMYDTNGNKLNVEVKDNEFIMPDADIIIKVNYKKMVNPPTSDNIYINVLLLLISTIGLTIITKKTLKA